MFLLNLAILKKEPSEKLQIIQFLLKLKNPFFTMAKIFKIGSGLSCPYQILLSPSSTMIEEIFKISLYTEIFLLSYFYQISQFLFSPILEKLLGLDYPTSYRSSRTLKYIQFSGIKVIKTKKEKATQYKLLHIFLLFKHSSRITNPEAQLSII